MDSFENLIMQVHNEKLKNEVYTQNKRELLGENIYTLFWVWCNTKKDGKELRKSPKVFGEWLKKENIILKPYQRKAIAENHFGYVYEWNYDKGKYIIKRGEEQ